MDVEVCFEVTHSFDIVWNIFTIQQLNQETGVSTLRIMSFYYRTISISPRKAIRKPQGPAIAIILEVFQLNFSKHYR